MFYRKMPELSVKKQLKAFSLIELLITLSAGSILLFIFAHFHTDIYRIEQQQRTLLDLQQQAHHILHYLQQHILHIGYQGKQRSGSNFEWFKRQSKAYYVDKNCLVFIQDLNGDGCLGKRSRQCTQGTQSITKDVQKEIIAMKVENKTLWTLGKQNKFTPCSQGQCEQWLKSCRHLIWEKVASVSDTQIEHLSFQWEKEPMLLKIELALSATKYPDIRYSAIAYSYVLNGAE